MAVEQREVNEISQASKLKQKDSNPIIKNDSQGPFHIRPHKLDWLPKWYATCHLDIVAGASRE